MSAIIATAEAGARVAEVSGGMSLISSEFVSTLLTGIAGIVSTALVYFKMKGKREDETQTVKIKRPLDHDDVYVTKGECQQHRCAIEKRIEMIGPALHRLFDKLSDVDKKSEERSIRLHDRLEPMLMKVAANSEAIELLKDDRRENNAKRNARKSDPEKPAKS